MARIAVLLAVYDGEAFLQDQIDSLARQSVGGIDLWVSDDGSRDRSAAILETAARNWTRGSFQLVQGPGAGFSENFRSLLLREDIEADFFAFCDQDDLWDHDKLEVALDWLMSQSASRPALFCSRTRIITAEGAFAGLSPLFRKPPSFRNALVQSIAGGNTMVMNRAARDAVKQASRNTSFISHDWWCYLVVTGVGGVVAYSPEPKIGYRQHSQNLVGENNSWRARIFRFRFAMGGRFIRWNKSNLAGLMRCQNMLTPGAQKAMRMFSDARSSGLPARVLALYRSGVYRQTLFGQVSLYAACLLKKL
jgi:glycosyltransferase involved in cell wall biosynthesis